MCARCTITLGKRILPFFGELLVFPSSVTFRSDSVTNAICFTVNGRKNDFFFFFLPIKCVFPHVPRVLPIVAICGMSLFACSLC